jgi:hypothetical protein
VQSQDFSLNSTTSKVIGNPAISAVWQLGKNYCDRHRVANDIAEMLMPSQAIAVSQQFGS